MSLRLKKKLIKCIQVPEASVCAQTFSLILWLQIGKKTKMKKCTTENAKKIKCKTFIPMLLFLSQN